LTCWSWTEALAAPERRKRLGKLLRRTVMHLNDTVPPTLPIALPGMSCGAFQGPALHIDDKDAAQSRGINEQSRGINDGEIFCTIFCKISGKASLALHGTGFGGGAAFGPLPRPRRMLSGLTTLVQADMVAAMSPGTPGPPKVCRPAIRKAYRRHRALM
jgi:hypothetical protein